MPCHAKHEHTDACHLYGFHDARRGFATFVGNELGRDQLQKMMRHKSYTTTQRYIDDAAGMGDVATRLKTPSGLDTKRQQVKNSGA